MFSLGDGRESANPKTKPGAPLLLEASTKMGSSLLPDSDWSKRTEAISFRRLIHLTPHPSDRDTFTSTSAAYPPTPGPRSYGGHVIGQAAWAASHTVPYGLHVHSITGYFLSIGDTRFALRYRVRRLRDGGVYAIRVVEAFQVGGEGPADDDEAGQEAMFMCMMSFKRDESQYHVHGHQRQRWDFKHQALDSDWLKKEYGGQLGDRHFEDFARCQGMDGLWPVGSMSVDEWKRRGDVFPGLEMRKVDMTGYNGIPCRGGLADGGDVARRWRLLVLYRLIVDDNDDKSNDEISESGRTSKAQTKTGADDELNLHACAHIYASDRNSLFLAQRALGLELMTGHIGSLSHTVNFHGGAESLRMIAQDSARTRKEFVQESWVSSSGDDRVCHESRIWDRATGRILASTVQDGMMRIPVKQDFTFIDRDIILQRKAKL